MRKVGVMTTSHAINYGAVLQAFSLKKAIEENTDSKVDIINYCGDEWVSGRKLYRKGKNIKTILVNCLCFMRVKYRKNRIKLISLFDDFKWEYLEIHSDLIKRECDLRQLDMYDTYVCGSDQVWNIKLNDDTAYFLSFVKSKYQKVAYAVSISDHLSDEQKQIIADRIQDFRAISIREKDDAESFSVVLNREVENIVDPVFLHNEKEWKQLLSLNDNDCEPYVLVFLISHHKNDQKIIDKIRNNRKVKVLNLHPVNYIKGYEILNVCSPQEFVELIEKADAVVTDSFHCTAFSIIFNKEFYNIKRPTRNNRIENLYRKFEIESRFIDENVIEVKEIDYKRVNYAIEKEAKLGIKYIVENIGRE